MQVLLQEHLCVLAMAALYNTTVPQMVIACNGHLSYIPITDLEGFPNHKDILVTATNIHPVTQYYILLRLNIQGLTQSHLCLCNISKTVSCTQVYAYHCFWWLRI